MQMPQTDERARHCDEARRRVGAQPVERGPHVLVICFQAIERVLLVFFALRFGIGDSASKCAVLIADVVPSARGSFSTANARIVSSVPSRCPGVARDLSPATRSHGDVSHTSPRTRCKVGREHAELRNSSRPVGSAGRNSRDRIADRLLAWAHRARSRQHPRRCSRFTIASGTARSRVRRRADRQRQSVEVPADVSERLRVFIVSSALAYQKGLIAPPTQGPRCRRSRWRASRNASGGTG
jgi:hypothetical protein